MFDIQSTNNFIYEGKNEKKKNWFWNSLLNVSRSKFTVANCTFTPGNSRLVQNDFTGDGIIQATIDVLKKCMAIHKT